MIAIKDTCRMRARNRETLLCTRHCARPCSQSAHYACFTKRETEAWKHRPELHSLKVVIHAQCMRIPFMPRPHQYFVTSDF